MVGQPFLCIVVAEHTPFGKPFATIVASDNPFQLLPQRKGRLFNEIFETMFYHSKELQFNARVSRPDARFARLMLEQFGGGNGELSACMQYFLQAFACHNPYPEKYDMLMDIATEELGHLEIVGATIQMLLSGVNANMKDAAEECPIFEDDFSKDDFIHSAFSALPHFGVISAGGPCLVNSNGVPWSSAYVSANGDLTVDLRSNLASETRAKIVYEYLLQFTDDPDVKATLHYLMAREVAHYQQFQAALDTIKPNFPPGTLQSDPRYTNIYSNNSCDNVRGEWNKGESCCLREEWQYVEDPIAHAIQTEGLTKVEIDGSPRTEASVASADKRLSKERSAAIRKATPTRNMQWCAYEKSAPKRKRQSVEQY